jgi:hypothetical protein
MARYVFVLFRHSQIEMPSNVKCLVFATLRLQQQFVHRPIDTSTYFGFESVQV